MTGSGDVVWRVVKIGNTRLAHHVGRHGLLLILLGLIWFVFGMVVIYIPSPPRFTDAANPTAFGGLIERPGVGWLWITSGVVSWFSAFFRRLHQPDVVGFNALLMAPLLWVCFYIWSLVAAIASGGVYGLYRSVAGIAVWAVCIIMIIVVAGWPDPDRPGGAGTPS
jgi:hypothetical protein